LHKNQSKLRVDLTIETNQCAGNILKTKKTTKIN